MRIIHEGGFPDEEKLSYRQTVFTNMIESITALTQAMTKLNIPIDDPENEDAFDFIHAQQCSHDLPEELCLAMRDLWQDEGVRACFQRRNEFQLYDTAA
jgi:hypothetical protein